MFTKNSTFCVAGLTALQVIFLAFVAAYCIKTLQKAHIHSNLCVFAALYFLLPYHALMAVTISADTVLAACLAGYISVLIRLFLKSDQKNYSKSKWISLIAPYFIFGFLICTLSRNGLIVFIISFPFILLTLKEKWKVPFFTSVVIFLLVGFIKFPFMRLYNIERKPFISYISPYIISIFTNDSDTSVWILLKQFFNESLPIVYPLGSYFTLGGQLNNAGLLDLPDVVFNTIFTMQDFLPLYGLFFSSGIPFWISLISLFLCITNSRVENITFLIPVLVFAISLGILPPATLEITEFYPLFFLIPLVVLLPFIDAESEY